MILEKLTLYNLGAFKGWNQLELEPKSSNRPVVLVGALNGSGKTTIHEAIQLVLFGRQCAPAKRDRISYEHYLAALTNQEAQPSDGALAELSFRHAEGASEVHYRIRRSWKSGPSGTKETLDVYVDGKSDPVLRDLWQEKVHEIFPARIASLFFFDGEKIEELADLSRLPGLLRQAVHSLLGLDVVEQLSADLDVLSKRKKLGVALSADIQRVTELEAELSSLEGQRSGLHRKQAEESRRRELLEQSLAEKRDEFRQIGGERFEEFDATTAKLTEARARVAETRSNLRLLSEEALPLQLLRGGILDRCVESLETTAERDRARASFEAITERDHLFDELLCNHAVDSELARKIKAHLDNNREELEGLIESEAVFPAELHDAVQMNVLASKLPEALGSTESCLDTLRAGLNHCQALERQLEAMPAEDQIAKVKEELRSLTEELERQATMAKMTTTELASVDHRVNGTRRQITSELEAALEQRAATDEVKRLVDYIGMSKALLGDFQTRVVRHHLARIESFAMEALKLLMRKNEFIAAVEIDPNEFGLTLRGGDWVPIDIKRLSAGERQLVATALLWALSKAAGRNYPTIIDTPLGRLDSRHRSRLVESYFPQAGSQVVLLSTDEEITGRYLDLILPHVSHSYTLEYSEADKGTKVKQGYFTKEELVYAD